MYTCVFILLKLSGEREFSVELNRPIGSVPSLAHVPLLSLLAFPDFHDGTYGDALIVIAHQLIMSSPNHLDALLKVLLTILANVSPYLTRIGALASVRLLALFELFTEPGFLHANATNHQYALLLLDLFNNAVQYQYVGSGQLILAIVRRARAFYALRITAPSESYTEPMHGVGGKGHAVVFHRLNAQQQQQQQQQPLPQPQAQGDAPLSSTPTASLPTVASSPAISSAPQPVTGEPSTASPASSSATSNVSSSAEDGGRTQRPLSASQPLPSTDAAAPPSAAASAPAMSVTLPHPPPRPHGSAAVGSEEWAASWKARLPLECIFRLFDFLLPKVEAMARANPLLSDASILHFIQSQTLVGILPLPHPIVVRRYIRNPFTNAWFSTYLWGVVFVKAQQAGGVRMFDAKKVRLFVISGKGGKAGAAAAGGEQQQQQQQQQQDGAGGGEGEKDKEKDSAKADASAKAPATT